MKSTWAKQAETVDQSSYVVIQSPTNTGRTAGLYAWSQGYHCNPDSLHVGFWAAVMSLIFRANICVTVKKYNPDTSVGHLPVGRYWAAKRGPFNVQRVVDRAIKKDWRPSSERFLVTPQ